VNQREKEQYLREYAILKAQGKPFFPYAVAKDAVMACVVLREGAAPDPAKATELQEFVKASIAPYKYPRIVEFVTELPKTISGKTQRYRLRQMAGAKLQARSG